MRKILISIMIIATFAANTAAASSAVQEGRILWEKDNRERFSGLPVKGDIKPSNLIVKPDGSLVLIDFNSAKEIKGTTGKDTVLIGTTGYAAPEQYGFYESMQTTDIYGIGVLFHELLTGQLPNQGSSCTNNLSPIIKKCTHMDPKQRYQTVTELDNALESAKIKKQNKQDPKTGFQAWLPPGFRSGKPLIMIVGFLWYLFFISVSLSL